MRNESLSACFCVSYGWKEGAQVCFVQCTTLLDGNIGDKSPLIHTHSSSCYIRSQIQMCSGQNNLSSLPIDKRHYWSSYPV